MRSWNFGRTVSSGSISNVWTRWVLVSRGIMPIYEYHCPECGSNTSEFEKYDTSSTHLCPCGGITFRTLSVPQRAQVIEGMLNRGD
ncbi:MAG TPA: hypothetical protein ENI23_11035, partial [bacterium]|nr:hypothetical protein [bacterium]